jgi:hypothetical protein
VPSGGARRARAPPATSAAGTCRPTPWRPTCRRRRGRTRRVPDLAPRARCRPRPPRPSHDRARCRPRSRRCGTPARARCLRRARGRCRARVGRSVNRARRARSTGRSPRSGAAVGRRAEPSVPRSRPRADRGSGGVRHGRSGRVVAGAPSRCRRRAPAANGRSESTCARHAMARSPRTSSGKAT